jgi:hypothetical protein
MSSDWLKWRANRGQEFVIGGYIPNGSVVDSLLVGYYEGRELMYGERACRSLIRVPACVASAFRGTSDSAMPIRQSAGPRRRPHGRRDDGLPLAGSLSGRTRRIPGVDTGESATSSAFRWHSQRQRCARGCARINRVGWLLQYVGEPFQTDKTQNVRLKEAGAADSADAPLDELPSGVCPACDGLSPGITWDRRWRRRSWTSCQNRSLSSGVTLPVSWQTPQCIIVSPSILEQRL